MSNRDDEYYDRGGRRPSSRDGRYRDDVRTSGRSNRDSRSRRERYDDDYYDERPIRRRESETSGRNSRSARDYDAPRRNGSSPRSGAPARNSSKKKNKAIILLASEIAVALVLLFVAYNVFYKANVTKVGKIDLDEEKIDESIHEEVAKNEKMADYTNIALFGLDNISGKVTETGRSDSIIIASINNDTGEIKLCSVYRDTYLNLGKNKEGKEEYNKCNAAYAKGGPDRAIAMLNSNLDMDITDSVTIGFGGLANVVDELGGVEIDVDEAELPHLNSYQKKMADDMHREYKAVTTPGVQKLTGLQATAYCRIRYTAGNDFARAARQREVLMKCIELAKTKSPAELEKIANKAFDETATTLDLPEILKMVKNVTKYQVVGDNGFPEESMRGTGRVGNKGSCVIPKDLESNVKWLHEFLFDDKEYQVSENVKKYSEKVAADTAGATD